MNFRAATGPLAGARAPLAAAWGLMLVAFALVWSHPVVLVAVGLAALAGAVIRGAGSALASAAHACDGVRQGVAPRDRKCSDAPASHMAQLKSATPCAHATAASTTAPGVPDPSACCADAPAFCASVSA